jgi:hypothetical protein
VATGTVLTPLGFFGAGWAVKRLAVRAGKESGDASRAAYVAAYTGAAIAASAGPALLVEEGHIGAALLGAGVGLGGSVLVAKLGNARYDQGRRCGVLCWTLGGLAVALPSVGATLAWNASRR